MAGLMQDLRYSMRRLARSPGFAIVAVLTLALGIGANTAIFSVINGMLLKPPGGVTEADRLVTIFTADFSSSKYEASSWPDYQIFRTQQSVFSDLAAFTTAQLNVVQQDQVQTLTAEVVTPNYFELLGISPVAGRLLSEGDGEGTVVMNEEVWRTRFGADRSLIGTTLTINGQAYTLVGIAPARFYGFTTGARIDAWVPIAAGPHLIGTDLTQEPRDSRNLAIIGRLQPGVTVEHAQAQMNAVQRGLVSEYGADWMKNDGQPRELTVLSERAGRIPPDQRGTLFTTGGLMLGAVAFVLLVCCANLANLLLARAATRELEVAIRYSLGARRWNVLRQMLVESALLACLGGVAGVVLAVWGVDLFDRIRQQNPGSIFVDTTLDSHVMLFAIAVSILAGLLFGIAPALRSAAPSTAQTLKMQRAAGRLGLLSDSLAAAQIAFALILSVGAGLIVRTLHNASAVDIGMDTENVVVANFGFPAAGYDPPRMRQFLNELRADLERRPDVVSTTLARRIPIAHATGRRGVQVTGYTAKPGEEMEFAFNVVANNYFDAMNFPITAGRSFNAEDRSDGPRSVIVNEAFVRRFWPGEDPVGREIATGGRPPMRVVGVARDGKYWSISESPRPYFYLPFEQNDDLMILHVRTRGDVVDAQDVIRSAARVLDPRLTVDMLDTMDGQMATVMGPQRVAAVLMGLFAVLCVLLAAVGVYGVTSVLVSQRIPEIGLRIALGATTPDVLRLVVGRALAIAAIGIASGLLLSVWATRVIESLLFGLSRFDPATFTVAAASLLFAATLAGYLPARRAARIDPLAAING